jgi:antitoxin YefM
MVAVRAARAGYAFRARAHWRGWRVPGRRVVIYGQAATQGQRLAKVAILMAMSVGEQMSLADVKNRLSEVVDRLEREHGRVVITKHGHPAAVVISVEDLESLEETLDVMGSEALLGDIREALAELASADAPVLSKDEALRLIPGR